MENNIHTQAEQHFTTWAEQHFTHKPNYILLHEPNNIHTRAEQHSSFGVNNKTFIFWFWDYKKGECTQQQNNNNITLKIVY